MNPDLAARLDALRRDFAEKTGAPFDHFYCPLLHRDEAADLCRAHVVPAAFRDSDRAWTVQRADVDNFYGAMFEADVLLLQERGRHSLADVLADPDLSKRLRPAVTLDGEPVAHYRPRGRVPESHTKVEVSRDDGPRTTLVLKLEPSEVLAARDRSWGLSVARDLKVPAVASLLKAAHLTLFAMLGYSWGLTAAAHFVGFEVLGRFFLEHRAKPKAEVLAAADPHFREFASMVRPIVSEAAKIGSSGTVSDGHLYLCGEGDRPWAFLVFVRTAEQYHAVLLPTFAEPDDVARFFAFLDDPAPRFAARLARFVNDVWEVSPTRRTFVWPEARWAEPGVTSASTP